MYGIRALWGVRVRALDSSLSSGAGCQVTVAATGLPDASRSVNDTEFASTSWLNVAVMFGAAAETPVALAAGVVATTVGTRVLLKTTSTQ